MIEKMLEKFEELRGNICAGIPCNGCDYNKDCYEGEHAENRAIDLCKKIVQEVIKEYSAASDTDLAVVSALPSLYPLQAFEEEAIHKVIASAKDGGWIPCSERLPNKSGKYIVTQKRYAIDDRTHKSPIAVEVDYVEFNSRDGEWQRANFFEIIAWQPLPAPYQKGE